MPCPRLLMSLSAAGLAGVFLTVAAGCPASSESPADSPASPGSARLTPTRPRVEGPRLVILGFDGVDPSRVDGLVAAGRLPNLAALGKRGYRGPLATTNPPQSPVAWSAFATGMGAGHHGIFDFIGRDLKSMFPQVATTRVTHAEVNGGAITHGRVENLREGPSFWDVIAGAGKPVRALSVPYAYPPPPGGAHALGGLGTPDVRGTNSVFTLLTTDAAKIGGKPPAGGQVAALEPAGAGVWRAVVAGPRLRVDGQRKEATLDVMVRSGEGGVQIEMGGVRQQLAVGQSGDYVTLTFVPSPSFTIQAATRATLRRGAPTPEIYLEPLSSVPAAPYFPVSEPPSLAQDLWQRHGAFKTVGWIHDTSALGGGAMDEQQFVDEAMATMKRRARITLEALAEGSDRLFVSVFTAPDRIGHTFYRYLDAAHPAPKEGDVPHFAAALDASYDEMDRIVGEVVKLLAADDLLLVMSDHGFGSFRRGFHMNRWLVRQGYLVLKKGVREPRDFFLDVDWAKTRAYAMGTGSIYINIAGRERDGAVAPGKAAGLAKEIAAKIRKVRDGKVAPVVAAYLGDDLYPGPARREAPDIRVAMIDGYRASWATTLGGIPQELFEDNTKKWSGDHASADPAAVPGILVANRPIAGAPRIEDLAATAYAFCGVKPPANAVGRSLLGAAAGE